MFLIKASRTGKPEKETTKMNLVPDERATEKLKLLKDKAEEDLAEMQSEKQTLLEIIDQGKKLKNDIKKDLESVLMPRNDKQLKDEVRPTWFVKEGIHAKMEEVSQKSVMLDEELRKYSERIDEDKGKVQEAIEKESLRISALEEKLIAREEIKDKNEQHQEREKTALYRGVLHPAYRLLYEL